MANLGAPRTADDRVLNVIFNPEEPVGSGADVWQGLGLPKPADM